MFFSLFFKRISPFTPPEQAKMQIEDWQRAKAAALSAELKKVCLRHKDRGLDRKLMVKVAGATARELEKLAK